MWKFYDYECTECGSVFEEMINSSNPEPIECASCGSAKVDRRMPSPAVLTSIVPSYPGSKRVKAGYQHTHNRPAEKAGSQVSMFSTKKD